MKKELYKKVYSELNSLEDLEPVSKKHKVEKDVLKAILIEKTIRNTIKRFHVVKNRKKRLHSDWKGGKTFMQLANVCRFSPMLCASFIIQEEGHSKKKFREFVTRVDSIKNERVKKELKEAIQADYVYSHWGEIEQRERGEIHERKVGEWLKKKGIPFWTEQDRKGLGKTPDFLLKKKIKLKGRDIHWIESKAYFADEKEIRRTTKKQLQPYVELFGPGMVVYWFGFIEDTGLPDDVVFVDRGFFKG